MVQHKRLFDPDGGVRGRTILECKPGPACHHIGHEAGQEFAVTREDSEFITIMPNKVVRLSISIVARIRHPLKQTCRSHGMCRAKLGLTSAIARCDGHSPFPQCRARTAFRSRIQSLQ
jgi:hypothetical protein